MKEIILQCKGWVILGSCFRVAVALMSAITTYLSADLLNYAVMGDIRRVILQTFMIFGAYGCLLLLDYITDLVIGKSIQKMNMALRDKILRSIISKPYHEFSIEGSGVYLSWLTQDVNLIETHAFMNLFSILGNISSILFTIIAMYRIQSILLIVALFLSFVMLLLPKVVGRKMNEKNYAVSNAQEKFLGKLKDYLSGFGVLYYFNTLKNLRTSIIEEGDRLEQKRYEFKKYQSKSMQLIGFGRIISQVLMIGLTALLVATNWTTIGVIFPVTEYSGTLFSSISGLINRVMLIKANVGLFDKYKESEKRIIRKINFNQQIEIKNLNFKYEDKELFKNLNLCFQKGKKYALVGPSGCGKSTLIKILLGELESYRGDIFIDGQLVLGGQLNDKIAYVGQEVHLFNETIIENMTLREFYSEDQILDAMEKSNLDGVDIGTQCCSLSGGQKQRVALSRALIRKRPILILDEGTAALDYQNTVEIEARLLEDTELTLIMITHHLNPRLKIKYDKVIDISSF